MDADKDAWEELDSLSTEELKRLVEMAFVWNDDVPRSQRNAHYKRQGIAAKIIAARNASSLRTSQSQKLSESSTPSRLSPEEIEELRLEARDARDQLGKLLKGQASSRPAEPDPKE